MAFTTATVQSVQQGVQQFPGAFKEMWLVSLTVDPASIAAGAEDIATFTVPNIALGDMVKCYSTGVNPTVDADINIFISAANTLSIRISNLNGAAGLDLASSTWKVLIGRPAW
jgi:hypothetical protein